jgi:hypothetical protein
MKLTDGGSRRKLGKEGLTAGLGEVRLKDFAPTWAK